MKKINYLTLLLSFIIVLINTPFFASGEVPSTYISQLKVALKSPQIKLTWKDASEGSGTVLIYRHTEEINASNWTQATLAGRVPYGTETFIDTPNSAGSYYYALLIQEENGNIHREFLPFRNKTVTPVVVESVASEEERAAYILAISAEALEDRIVIRFIASRGDRELLLYRSTDPIVSLENLLSATEIAKFSSTTTEWVDYPVPGVPYYYAVVDAKLMELKQPQLEKGKNLTSTFAEIPLPLERKVEEFFLSPLPPLTIRPIPLPYYVLKKTLEEGKPLPGGIQYPPTSPISPSTARAIEELIKPLESISTPSLTPTVLSIDKSVTFDKEEQMLLAVIQGPFRKKEWENTVKQINLLVKLPLSREVRNRAFFYKGQAQYFLGFYREAFMDFLLASSEYFLETQPWMDGILQLIQNQPSR
ncbi:MAG: hypothetical protein SNJ78_10630 [Spirochaetales bacterium]